MDAVHQIDKKPWISQTKRNIRELLDRRCSQLRTNNVTLDCSSSDLVAYDQGDEFKRLTGDLAQFAKEDENDVKPHFSFNLSDERFLTNDPDCPLKMYQLQLEHAKRMIADRSYKVNYISKLKTTRKEMLMRHLAQCNRPSSQAGLDGTMHIESHNQLAAIVVVQTWPQPNKMEKVRLEKEIFFRSSQPLTDLRDQFKCQRDYGVPMDLSENPDQQAEKVFRGELFKSGFFLIEDTFYSDLRDPNNTDLSAPIIEWASEDVTVVGQDGRNTRVSRGIGPFNQERMELTKLEDLNFRLGYPYLYFHQGDCEHIFTISDIRYVPNDLKFAQTTFPFVTATSIGRKEDNLRCYMCRNRPPHWYTRNNDRLPVDPFFFCENCFHTFNYDRDRKKIGHFQAYLYTSAFGIPDSIVMNVKKQNQISST